MPLNGAGLAAKPAGTTAVSNTTIESSKFNSVIDDIYNIFNTARPIAYGGTGGTSVITGWDGLAAKGTDIADGATINLTTATGPSITMLGTTTLTGVTLAEGSFRLVRAAAAKTITASANLLVNGSAVTPMTVAAEDLLVFRGGAAGVVSVARIGSASVAAATTTAAGIVELATLAETLAGTDAVRAVTPSTLYFPTGHLYGLTLSNNGSDATNDIDIAVGTARDSTDSYNMALASALTKRIDAAWAVGTNQGGLATGVAVTNTTYYIFLIKRTDTSVVDVAFDTSSSGANIAANTNAAYTILLAIGQVTRAGGVNGTPIWYPPKATPTLNYGIITPWVAYTPVFTGLGTVASISVFSRRVGSNLQARGYFTTGTPTATEARISIGFNGTSGNVSSDSTVIAAIQQAGPYFAQGVAVTFEVIPLIESGVAYFTLGAFNSGNAALTKILGNTLTGSTKYAFMVDIPIQGWQ